MAESYSVVISTTGSKEEADRLAELLVTRRLAACVQVTPISSTYMWQGKLERAAEYLLLIKTTSQRYAEVEAAIVANHSYEVPEIIRLPIAQGLSRYLAWVDENTRPGGAALGV